MDASRHDERDRRLPQAREELLENIIRILQADGDVIGIFLGGSIAQGNTDLYSDIDLRFVVKDGHLDRYIARKQTIASEFGDVLFFEDMNPHAPYTIAHYSSFIKVDMFIYTFHNLHPSLWLQGIRIVSDPTGRLQNIRDQSEQLVYRVTADEAEMWRGKVFAYVHEVYRRVMREEFYYALGQMNNLRAFVVQGWNMEADRRSNDAWDWSKIEGARSPLAPWQLSMLRMWDCGRDRNDIMKTLRSMVPEIRRLHAVLCAKTGLEERPERMDKVLDLVL